jgi:hypothetical protein
VVVPAGGGGVTVDSDEVLGGVVGYILWDLLPLEVEERGVGEVPRWLSSVTRLAQWMAACGAAAPITGSEREEAKWVHDISEPL